MRSGHRQHTSAILDQVARAADGGRGGAIDSLLKGHIRARQNHIAPEASGVGHQGAGVDVRRAGEGAGAREAERSNALLVQSAGTGNRPIKRGVATSGVEGAGSRSHIHRPAGSKGRGRCQGATRKLQAGSRRPEVAIIGDH